MGGLQKALCTRVREMPIDQLHVLLRLIEEEGFAVLHKATGPLMGNVGFPDLTSGKVVRTLRSAFYPICSNQLSYLSFSDIANKENTGISADLAEVMDANRARKTTLTEYFEANRTIPLARETSYVDFPTCFTWQATEKKWVIRKKGFTIGRLYFVSPSAGERYFLRALMTSMKGAKSYRELRTYNNHTHNTFKAACVARGFFENDDEGGTMLA